MNKKPTNVKKTPRKLAPGERILRNPELDRRSGLSRSHRYCLAKQGLFPKMMKLGPRASGIYESDFEAWLKGLAMQDEEQDLSAA
jgi:prophage regulatory protein